jgi:hypothetical protein
MLLGIGQHSAIDADLVIVPALDSQVLQDLDCRFLPPRLSHEVHEVRETNANERGRDDHRPKAEPRRASPPSRGFR